MSRLLFAAARGARIEYKGGYPNWREAEGEYKSLRNHPDLYRVHPDDVHLQYGPISTALRQGADQYCGKQPSGLGRMLCLPFVAYHSKGCGKINDELHRSLFLLILAEALADEGL